MVSRAGIAEASAGHPPKTGILKNGWAPIGMAALAFVVLFFDTFRDLVAQWWSNPDAGHGLLLGPVCIWLAYRSGVTQSPGSPVLGSGILGCAVLLRLAGTLAGEHFTMRLSLVVALVGVVVYWRGLPLLRRWWLPFVVGALAIPLPAVLLNSLAIPLQLMASKIGAALIDWRNIPYRLSGNVIDIPGHRLFVAEACSGLRSLTALLSLGVLIGGLYLGKTWTRVVLVALTIPVAVLLNGARVFLTAFLMFFVDPSLGQGFMHLSEGWLIFVIAFGAVSGVAALLKMMEPRTSEGQLNA